MKAKAFIPCTLKTLPEALVIKAALAAIECNPVNRPVVDTGLTVARIAALTSKYWGAGGVTLTVGFPFDNPPKDLRAKIISHMNSWSQDGRSNIKFAETSGTAQVRIARTKSSGYWSYLGVDVLSIPKNQPTMNLDSFTMNTPDREFFRVVRHETGHTLAFPHEHMRADLVARLDRAKTITYFRQTQGWSEQETMQQVLTPLSEASLMATPADQTSVMCYQLPGSITKDGKPIPGGNDINESDLAFAAKIYPSVVSPPEPPVPPTPPVDVATTMIILGQSGKEMSRYKLTRITP